MNLYLGVEMCKIRILKMRIKKSLKFKNLYFFKDFECLGSGKKSTRRGKSLPVGERVYLLRKKVCPLWKRSSR